jgi:hypothetical protein
MILRNGKIYISHAAGDEALYAALVTKLAEKHVNCWTAIDAEDSDSQLSARTQQELAGRDVLLRICTPAAKQSARMRLETAAYRAIQQEDANRGAANQHIIIDLIMDPAYTPDPADPAYQTLNTTNRPMNDWLIVLYNEVGRMQAKRALSQRAMTILVIVCVIIALLLIFFVTFNFAHSLANRAR